MLRQLVNWRYLLSRVAIAIVALVVISLAIEPLLHTFLTTMGERIMRSKIDIEGVDVTLSNADVEIQGVQVANPKSLDRNLIECDSATLDIVAGSVLQRRLRVREARLSGVRFNTPRSKSGKADLPQIDLGFDDLDTDLSKVNTNALRQFARIISHNLQEDLVSIQLARELSARWPDELDQLEAKVTAYIERMKGMATSLEGAAKNPRDVAMAFPNKVEEIDQLRREYYQLRDELDRIVEQAERDQQAVAIARRHDTEVIRRKLALRELNAQELSEYLLGEDLTEQTRSMLRWIKLARRYWPKDAEMPAAERQSGEDIAFPGVRPLPRALVERMRVDGSFISGAKPVNWRAEVLNLTTDPAIVAKPMIIRAQTHGERPLLIEATLDRTTAVARDRIVLSLPKLKQPARTLGNPEQLAVSLGPGEMLTWAELNLVGEELTGRVLVEQKELQITTKLPEHYGPRIAQRVQEATTHVNVLQAEVRLAGTLDRPTWKLQSNLGPQLAASLTAALRAELDARQVEIAAKLDQYLEGERTRLADRMRAQEEKVSQKLANSAQEMEGLKRVVAGRIRLPGGRAMEDIPFHNPFIRR